MMSMVAGISRTVSPSRLPLDATPLVFNGDWAAAASTAAGRATAATGRADDRRAKRPELASRLPAVVDVRLAGLRCGCETTTGASSFGLGAACAMIGFEPSTARHASKAIGTADTRMTADRSSDA